MKFLGFLILFNLLSFQSRNEYDQRQWMPNAYSSSNQMYNHLQSFSMNDDFMFMFEFNLSV